MHRRIACRSVALVASGLISTIGFADEPVKKAEEGTIHVQAFDLPVSSLLSPEAQQILKRPAKGPIKPCPSLLDAANLTVETVKAVRRCQEENDQPRIEKMKTRFDVVIEPRRIAGVATEIFTPRGGVSAQNKDRVLINLHGGGFIVGNARGEAIPIAGVGKIKVVGVDYRMGPEYKFPAASEDVAAVYKELLKDYAPARIGIYGCSAGGRLTTHSMAWFQKAGLPLPGAIGAFSSGAAPGVDGDSAYIGSAIAGRNLVGMLPTRQAYFGKSATISDPLSGPLDFPEVLSKFPPTLLISATRDYGMSNIIRTHSELVRVGVAADLHLWEGLGHCFFYDPDLPESREAYEVIVKFFAARLGKPGN